MPTLKPRRRPKLIRVPASNAAAAASATTTGRTAAVPDQIGSASTAPDAAASTSAEAVPDEVVSTSIRANVESLPSSGETSSPTKSCAARTRRKRKRAEEQGEDGSGGSASRGSDPKGTDEPTGSSSPKRPAHGTDGAHPGKIRRRPASARGNRTQIPMALPTVFPLGMMPAPFFMMGMPMPMVNAMAAMGAMRSFAAACNPGQISSTSAAPSRPAASTTASAGKGSSQEAAPTPLAAAPVEGHARIRITEKELIDRCEKAGVPYIAPPVDHDESREERTKRIAKINGRTRKDRISNKKKQLERFLREEMNLSDEEVNSILPAMVMRFVEIEGRWVGRKERELRRVATKLFAAHSLGEDLFEVASADYKLHLRDS